MELDNDIDSANEIKPYVYKLHQKPNTDLDILQALFELIVILHASMVEENIENSGQNLVPDTILLNFFSHTQAENERQRVIDNLVRDHLKNIAFALSNTSATTSTLIEVDEKNLNIALDHINLFQARDTVYQILSPFLGVIPQPGYLHPSACQQLPFATALFGFLGHKFLSKETLIRTNEIHLKNEEFFPFDVSNLTKKEETHLRYIFQQKPTSAELQKYAGIGKHGWKSSKGTINGKLKDSEIFKNGSFWDVRSTKEVVITTPSTPLR